MTDHALAAQRAAEEHLQACWASLDEDGEVPDAIAAFCGCLTCEVREVLNAAYPHLRALWEEDVMAALDELDDRDGLEGVREALS